ncbi:hypothetical protein ACR96V_31695 [Pseudomonas aeruginosa]|uniref:hypothetical protein n=1 Tax=Pseudomonas aeruginosa TaxID=287 RepID=UPI000514718B|nr:hypothetical protein [Pseudomonas aeruginosa]KHE66155.1 hypothetical protein D480_0202315 [Pseudomonas aeruginosa]MBX6190343.1 hypothetical protein [Pseudomonas aeruginosa]MBX6717017.1 hypothetical protein [Pseudomonas aeruginosa]MBX6872496.1 hypothetical protein [Pseudomonas aeruginosa]MCS7706821.1 hypothetical protein [Pseudomonas aeruginosa]
MSLDRANEILRNYNQCYEQFDTLRESLSRFFAGTPLAEEMRTISACIEQAYECNVDAGWLPEEESIFNELELLVANIKHDGRGRHYKGLSDVPEHLRQGFDQDEQAFRDYLEQLRENCREAYDLISEQQEILAEALEQDLLEDAWNQIDEEFMTKNAKSIVNQVFEHLLADWRQYAALASELVKMANELDNPDPDRSLTKALLFD